jgi:formylglycine-generating enzyme required for sulfatase activity
MEFVPIPAGTFIMGENSTDEKEWNEIPLHYVQLSQSFFMGATPVTNAQFERFDPGHSKYRGWRGLSEADDEAVIFVSWDEAVAFCEWLSGKEGRKYRLPTEAEWEYACRAGTTTIYWMGDEFPDEFDRCQMNRRDWNDDTKPYPPYLSGLLKVKQSPPNPFGLHDMHGLVEEWCLDWYGSYRAENQIDPIGPREGLCRVCRGGSHHTDIHYLRSATRLAALPADKHWMLGFRLVCDGRDSFTHSAPTPVPTCMDQVSQSPWCWDSPNRNAVPIPIFLPPIPYVIFPPNVADGPYYPHNHCPAITWCPNGDLFAVWFSTIQESGREMVILGSRLRAGNTIWDPASVFLHIPGRNLTGSSLFHDGHGRILHFNGIEVSGSWSHLAMALRESRDNGQTWSPLRFISPEHRYRNQVISCTRRTTNGTLIQCCDAVPGGEGGTAIHLSNDEGYTWRDPGLNHPDPTFENESCGSWIAGIHASVVELKDGSLLAMGRGNSIENKMPISRSNDGGETWTYSPSEFPPINGSQRLVLMRLQEGPLFFASFTDRYFGEKAKKNAYSPQGMQFRNSDGTEFTGFGLFVALSLDEGETWPIRRLLTDGNVKSYTFGEHLWHFRMDSETAEPRGYLAATQTPDGMIHLISSALHYRFNSAWILDGKH